MNDRHLERRLDRRVARCRPSLAACVAAVLGAAACGGGGSSVPPPEPRTFTVSVWVTGLAGSGLVLQDQEGDDLPIPSAGAFTFATRVADGAAYSVTVKAQPTGPSQLCEVAGGAGAVSGADVSVTVTCQTRSFEIGGTASGVAGPGLVLRTLDGETLAIAADGPFSFPTPVLSGSDYRIGVWYSPSTPPQACTLTGGSGTVGDGPVTDLAVTCVTKSFTVGGTVSGLAGAGLVLRNSGGDDLAVAADGPFTFATSVVYGGTYTVTVGVPPSGPDQRCAVVRGEGTVGAANVTSVEVRCDARVWRTATLRESDAAGDALVMGVAASYGGAVAAWRQSAGTRDDLKSSAWDSSGGWSTASLVETDDTATVSYADVAMRDGGLAVWSQGGDVWSSGRDIISGAWGTPQHVEQGAGEAIDPRVAKDGAGNAMAVWTQHDGAAYSITANRYTSSGGWGSAVAIESGAGLARQPSLAVDPAGNAVAVWIQSDGTRDDVWSNRFDVTKGWGTARLLEQDDRGTVWEPSIVADPAGNAIAVWSQSDGTDYHSWAARYVDGTGWGTPELLDGGLTQSVGPRLAVGSDGAAVAVYIQQVGLHFRVHARRFTASGGWGAPEVVDTATTGDSTEPVVGIDGSGNAIVAWRHGSTSLHDAWANRYTPGSGWGVAQQIETSAADIVLLNLAVDANGTAFAVWSQSDGTQYHVYANVYW